MYKENVELMREARESLNGKWGLAVGTCFILSLLLGGSFGFTIMYTGGEFHPHPSRGLINLILGGPLTLGACIFALNIARNQEARFEQIFDGFKNFINALSTYLLMVLYIFLWTLLLVIPGIMMAIAYSQSLFILAENPNMPAAEVLRKSKDMMYGYKWKYFRLSLRFIAWSFVCVLTLGIGFLFLFPYMYVTYAKFYDHIKDNPCPRVL